jgi:hypothetical protein
MFIFIETRLFTRLADEHLSDDELSRLQGYLNENAEVGLLTLYAKNEAESIPGSVLKKIKEEIDG